MSLPVLSPGTLVKPQTRDGRFHWWAVVSDPGPVSDPRRIIELARTEPERADQHIRLRRDRVHTDASRRSRYDVKPTLPSRHIDRNPDTGRFVASASKKHHGRRTDATR